MGSLASSAVYIFGLALIGFTIQPVMPSIVDVLPVHIILLLVSVALIMTSRAVGTYLMSLARLGDIVPLSLLVYVVVSSFAFQKVEWLQMAYHVTGLLVCLMGLVVSSRTQWVRLCLRMLGLAAVASTAVVIVQRLPIELPVWGWTPYDTFAYGAPGLEFSPVTYGYSIVGIATIFVGSALFQAIGARAIRIFGRPSDTFIALFLTVGLALSGSRSGVFGLVLGSMLLVSFVFVALRGKQRSNATYMALSQRHALRHVFGRRQGVTARFFATLLFCVSIGAILMVYGFNVRGGIGQDSRIAETWALFVPLLIDSPMGISSALSTVGDEWSQRQLEIWDLGPHNLFLTAGVTYGVVGIAYLVGVYAYIVVRTTALSLRSKRITDGEALALAMLAASANVAIVGHGWFHNNSILFGEMRAWFWLGLSVGLVRALLSRGQWGQER